MGKNMEHEMEIGLIYHNVGPMPMGIWDMLYRCLGSTRGNYSGI